MGKCIICGRTAKNSYEYYEGDIRTKGFWFYPKSKKKPPRIISNIVKCNRHICSHCVYKETIRKWRYLSGAFLCLAFLPYLYDIAAELKILISLPFILIAIIFLFPCFATMQKRKNDIPADEEDVAIMIIKNVEKDYDGECKALLTPSEYNNLVANYEKNKEPPF